jgi:hypothetical protein
LDASFLPRDLTATLLRTLGKKYRIIVEMENGNKGDHDDRKNIPIVKYNEGSFDDFKAILEDILKKWQRIQKNTIHILFLKGGTWNSLD